MLYLKGKGKQTACLGSENNSNGSQESKELILLLRNKMFLGPYIAFYKRPGLIYNNNNNNLEAKTQSIWECKQSVLSCTLDGCSSF